MQEGFSRTLSELHKVGTLSSGTVEIDALSVNYWFIKFSMEVFKKTEFVFVFFSTSCITVVSELSH